MLFIIWIVLLQFNNYLTLVSAFYIDPFFTNLIKIAKLNFTFIPNIIRHLSLKYLLYYGRKAFSKHFLNNIVTQVDVYTSKIVNLVNRFN